MQVRLVEEDGVDEVVLSDVQNEEPLADGGGDA